MLKDRNSLRLALCTLAALLALSVACSKRKVETDDEEASDEEEVAAVVYKPTGNEGTITGKITLNGTPAAAVAPKPIDMSSEASCAVGNPNPMTETVVAKDGKLANVFVYIKDGTTTEGNKKIGNLAFTAPTGEVVLDQKGCHYRPHVLGLQVGQTLKVTNSDTATHNVHPQPAASSGNPEWNKTQAGGAAPILETFKRPEVVIPVKCNQHNWMKSYVGVLKHPFYAVTGEDGSFEIKGVPPGTYTVETWQETYKTKSQQVTVPSKGAATVDVVYDAGAPTASLIDGSLKVMPAIEFPMLGTP